LDPASPIEIHGIEEVVVAKVIEFYLPKNFRRAFVGVAQTQPGKVIEFCSREKTSISTPPVGEVLARLLAATESDHAVGNE
jgi:hypothetical protein